MINKESLIDITTATIASFLAVFALLFTFLYPKAQVLTLTILTVLLPLVYQIGNIFSKESIRKENNDDYNDLEDYTMILEDENSELREYVDELEKLVHNKI